MPDEAMLLLKIIPALAACGLFLRIVGKETRRREKHLELRLHEEEERLRREAEAAAKAAEEEGLLGPVIDNPFAGKAAAQPGAEAAA